jgi:hypothetical protein
MRYSHSRSEVLAILAKLPEERRSFGAKNHTTSEQLAALATKAQPGLLIVYHAWISWWPILSPSPGQSVVLTTGQLHSTPDVLQNEIGALPDFQPVIKNWRKGWDYFPQSVKR